MERTSGIWDDLKASFGFLPALALLAGLVLGVGMPYVDDWLEVELPVVEFAARDPARSLLGTIATVTVSVAGLAFSVTLVALTLASSQLSPRVLRTFQADRLSQATLALFLGTFIYALVVLLRLGETGNGAPLPNLSITVAIVLAFASFAMFAWFLHHIVRSLQPSTLIRRMEREASTAVDGRYPDGVGSSPEDPGAAMRTAEERMRALPPRFVEAEGTGYVVQVRGEAIIAAARSHGALVRQLVPVGEYVVPGDPFAEVWWRPADEEQEDDDGRESLLDEVRGHFSLSEQRTPLQDVAFPIRQLADVALKGLSPGINDPTTAENAMDALAGSLIRFARAEQPPLVRVDEDGEPRFVALAPSLDDLVRLGFDQVRVFAAPYPVIAVRLLELLERIGRAARKAGIEAPEIARQARLVREGPGGEVPTAGDVESVEAAYERLHGAGYRGPAPGRAHVAKG